MGMPKSINVISRILGYFSPFMSDILKFEIVDLNNLGQGHGVQHFIANIKLYKYPITHFCASSHHLRDINITNV